MTNLSMPQLAVVDFNHHRGPEVEFWAGQGGQELFEQNDWSHIAFLALPDGAHATSEEFSYFTLLSKGTSPDQSNTSLFGISCTRQIRADRLKNKSPEVTRSFVQKAVVVIVENPGTLGQLRERVAAITSAWFAQEDFTNIEILKEFQQALQREASTTANEKNAYFALSLRELIHELRYQTLVLFKCLLLQKRVGRKEPLERNAADVLVFATRCERLCMTQFALVSLVPYLLENLQDCATSELSNHAKNVTRATNLRTSERSSLLAYMGLPLQLFGENSFLSPYTPLQQLDVLSSSKSHSYLAGSTNTLFLAQRDLPDPATNPHRYCDVLVNLDESSPSAKINILDPSLRSALSLSAADRRWIDHLTQTVLDTWNPNDPSRPTTHGYTGSEDAIRLSFEEYVLSLLSSTAYKNHFDNHPNPYLASGSSTEGVRDERYPDPLETAGDFNHDFLRMWKLTANYKIWQSLTSEASIFDIVVPRHPTAGGLNIEDVQRRVGAAMAELNIDERVRQGRETAGRAFEVGRERVGAGVARFWKEVEGFRDRREQSRPRPTNTEKEKENFQTDTSHPDIFDAGRKSTETPLTTKDSNHASSADTSMAPVTRTSGGGSGGWATALRARAGQVQRPNVDAAQVQAVARENAAKAGAYLSSWGSWAKEKSREWNESRQQQQQQQQTAIGTKSGDSSTGDVKSAMGAEDADAPAVGIQRQVSAGALAAARSAMVKPAGREEEKR